jgi:hypothetical protein
MSGGRSESAGQNRHGVGGESPPRSKGQQPATSTSSAQVWPQAMRQGAAMLKEEAIQYFKRKCVILVGKMRQVEEAISPVPKIP